MIDWLQQHWPWVVLVACAPILWAIIRMALGLGQAIALGAWSLIRLPFRPLWRAEQVQGLMADWRANSHQRPDETQEEWKAREGRAEARMREVVEQVEKRA